MRLLGVSFIQFPAILNFLKIYTAATGTLQYSTKINYNFVRQQNTHFQAKLY